MATQDVKGAMFAQTRLLFVEQRGCGSIDPLWQNRSNTTANVSIYIINIWTPPTLGMKVGKTLETVFKRWCKYRGMENHVYLNLFSLEDRTNA